MTSAAPLFPHTQDQLKEIAAGILRCAAQGGASSAAVEISEGSGFSVTVRRVSLVKAFKALRLRSSSQSIDGNCPSANKGETLLSTTVLQMPGPARTQGRRSRNGMYSCKPVYSVWKSWVK